MKTIKGAFTLKTKYANHCDGASDEGGGRGMSEKHEFHYEYVVKVCDKFHPDSFFITIARFGKNEKDKVNALVDLLRERSNLEPEAVMVTIEQCYTIPIADDSPLCKSVDAFHAKRKAAFDALKVKVGDAA